MLRALRSHWRLCAGGVLILATLAGCAGHYFVQRDPWRKDAEMACLKSGAVKEGVTIVRVEPINGPGMCGADFPMKVTALGDIALLGYSGELRPPGEVPGALPQRWPVTTEPRAGNPPRGGVGETGYSNPFRPARAEPQHVSPARAAPVERHPLDASRPQGGSPMPIVPPPGGYDRGVAREPAFDSMRAAPAAARRPSVYDAPSGRDADEEDEVELLRSVPRHRAAAPARAQPYPSAPPLQRPVSVPLGRGAPTVAAVGPVEIKPAATLACPIVSALDRWITDSIQPAAQRWFRQPVTEIRQISAYSCRGMNGQSGARISEHAFGNALDIASFVLADGRRITVKDGWRGSPEEQGFLRDVQGAACDQFNTVLAPGSNRFHYDHIHVDLMRRGSGHKICNPDAIAGEEVAARVSKDRGYASRNDQGVTGSIAKSRKVSLNGKPRTRPKVRNILADDDDDWIEDDGPRPAH